MCHLTHLPFIFVWKNLVPLFIQENPNKIWFSIHLIVPLASLNGNKGYNKAVCCYATDGSTAARIEEKVD